MLMLGKKLTEEQRLNKAVVDIMNKQDRYVALSSVLMVGERSVVEDVKTASTNGRDEMYGREFVAGLTDAQLRFLVLHETRHKLYRHLTFLADLNKEDPQIANMACDYVINLQIMDENTDGFVEMIEGACYDERFRGMNEVQVFNILKKEGQHGQGQGEGQGQGQKQGQSQDQSEGSEQEQSSSGGGLDEHDWDGAQELSAEERKTLDREIDEAIRQGALLAGKTGSGGFHGLEELLSAKVDWRDQLRDFVTESCAGKDYSTWRKPNRRFVGMDIYLPSTITETVDEMVVAIDTSGSIGGRILSQFLGEVASIAESVMPNKVRLLYWDTAVCREEVYLQDELKDIANSTKPSGGGGTTVQCVVDYLRDNSINPEVVVVLTDGYLGDDWGKGWAAPLMWCVVGNKSAKPTVGKYVHVEF